MSDSQTTSRFLGPLVDWLLPDLSESGRHAVLYTIRKSAHLVEYAVLALLAMRAFWLSWHRPPWQTSGLAALVVAAMAITDETLQGLTAERTSSAWDVLLDIAGGLAAMAGYWLIRRRWPSAKPQRSAPPTPGAEESP